jgi:hypothetical protein
LGLDAEGTTLEVETIICSEISVFEGLVDTELAIGVSELLWYDELEAVAMKI